MRSATTAAADRARAALASLRGRTDLTSAELVGLIEVTQAVMNQWAAAQTLASAQLAATDDVSVPEGLVEEFRGLGHIRLDAGALVSEALGVSDRVAVERVASAVGLVTRTRVLMDAMADGVRDAYRAGVVLREVDEADPEVADLVAGQVVTWAGDRLAGLPPAPLRARTKRLLDRVDPELVRTRQAKARADRDLRRWCDVDGKDIWEVHLTAEQAGPAYAAVDAKASDLRRSDPELTIGQARADGLIALIMGQTTAHYTLHLAVPEQQIAPEAPTRPYLADLPQQPTRPHVHAHAESCSELAAPAEGLLRVTGFGRPSGSTVLSRSWLEQVAADASTTITRAECHRETGALLQLSATDHVSDAARPERYVPPKAMRDLVRARDGHWRVPGCTIVARFCDLDHVRPWPTGPTAAENLMYLCHRHHRIKQRPRWRVTMTADARVTWTDPTGRQRITSPVDHLRADEAPVDGPLPTVRAWDGP
ncbi:MAG: hypothetical protein ACK5MP_01430 [Nostocoides sp.]